MNVMKSKDKFRMRISIVTEYENVAHSVVIKYDDDPTCDKVLQDFVDALFSYGYSWVHPKTENDCKHKDGTLLFGGHKLKEREKQNEDYSTSASRGQ